MTFSDKLMQLTAAFPNQGSSSIGRQEGGHQEALYLEIMRWGKMLPPFDPSLRTEENRVIGCQSLMYLSVEYKEGKLFFSADSDALISKGLAALLIFLYNGETPLHILTHPPTLIAELGLIASLTPGRANGFASLYYKMRSYAASHTV